MPIALLVGFVGLLFFNAAAHDEHPLCAIQRAFGGTCKPAPGTTGAIADRYAQASADAGGSVATEEAPATGTGGNRSRHSSGKARLGNSGRSDPGNLGSSAKTPASGKCPPYPKDLVTHGNVTLTSRAMASLNRAESAAGSRIVVGSSFRTDEQQISACNNICGGGTAGCPGLCAPSPGGCSASCHRDGEAIDVASGTSQNARAALKREGWCNFSNSDPNHYCHDGCR